jgi:serine-type D-Ala-D-Ala carboxypeptidase
MRSFNMNAPQNSFPQKASMSSLRAQLPRPWPTRHRRDFLRSLAGGCGGVWAAGLARPLSGKETQDSLRARITRELAAEPYPIPGAVVMVGTPDKMLLHEAIGLAQVKPNAVPMQLDSIFDVASVTKAVVTATACGICVDRGLLDPDAPLSKYLPDHKGKGVEKIILRRLASHTSGFVANPRLSEAGKGAAMFERMLTESPKHEVNTRYEYACRNIILLSTVIERLTGKPFGEFCTEEIFKPLGMKDSVFNRVEASPRVVGTHAELGVSHNRDTAAAGCAIGNAGLFTTAPDLARVCQMMLNGGVLEGKRVLSEKVIKDFTRTNQLPSFHAHGFIWKTALDSPYRPSKLSSRAYGHGGYTGQAVWVDPEKSRFTIVLSNRTHPKDISGAKETQYRKLGRIADFALDDSGA